jgi:hypothetical protein
MHERQKMLEEARKKHGQTFGRTGFLAFEEKEAREASSDEIEEYEATIDGKPCGYVKIIGTLREDIIQRNLGWLKSIYCRNHGMVDFEKASVDKKRKIVHLMSNKEKTP